MLRNCNFLTSFFAANAKKYSKVTYFGNQVVTPEVKTELVDSVFSKIANKYDLMNDIMSLGSHRLIKKYFVHKLHPTPNIKLLDAACGTGDIAFAFLHSAKQNRNDSKHFSSVDNPFTEERPKVFEKHNGQVVLFDMNENMLSICRKRAKDLGFEKDITCVIGTAESLPFPDNSFDAYTIGFGIRNVALMDQALLEAKRVLKQYGRFLCLEFSHVENPVLSKFYDFYSKSFPCFGQLVSGDWNSYQYLVESIRKFPHQEEFRERIEDAGFSCVSYENIFNGVVAIHSAFKL